jgi:hypothetical protein
MRLSQGAWTFLTGASGKLLIDRPGRDLLVVEKRSPMAAGKGTHVRKSYLES